MVRTTQASDIIAELRAEHIQAFVHALQGDFFIDEEMIADAIFRRSGFNLIHRASMFKVDVFIPRQRSFVEKQFSRSHMEILSAAPDAHANVCSAEDILLAKLEWYRMGGESSERQWRDVLGVLKVQAGTLDLDYMRQTAREIRVEDLLERALREA
jgi:hypothetical protein